MAMFLMKDLNSVFSSIVADYLRRGYVICLDSVHHYRVDMVMMLANILKKNFWIAVSSAITTTKV